MSSSEAEYQSLARAAQEAAYLRQLLSYLGCPQLSPTIIHEDNERCIAMVKNPVASECAKHIDIKVNLKYASKAYEDGVLLQVSCNTNNMLADDLTKALPAPTIERHIQLYMGAELGH
eukprot:2441610-Rhodomonas_salina.1